jgi:hypothetical protein
MKKYKTIVADPPWKYGTWGKASIPRSKTHIPKDEPMPYETMSVEEIMALNVASLADKNCELYLWTTQKYLPAPGIISIDSVIQKERIRKVTINWKCYGFAQLEYMTPYFLTPKISMVVEFGWNHFNPESLLYLKDEGDNLEKLKELFLNKGYLLYDENIKNSFGLYDVTMGYITGFDFSSQDGITFDCKTEIMSKHANYSGVQVKNAANISSDQNKSIIQSSFPEFLEKRLTKLPNCIEKKKSFRDPLDSEEEKAARGSDPTFFFNRFPFYMETSGSTPVAKPEDRIFIGRISKNKMVCFQDNLPHLQKHKLLFRMEFQNMRLCHSYT